MKPTIFETGEYMRVEYQAWFCQQLGLEPPCRALHRTPGSSSCDRFGIDADHLHTCQQHSGNWYAAHERLLTVVDEIVRAAERAVSATRRVLLPASVPRRSRVRPSFCTADWGCCSTTPSSATSGRQRARVAGGPRCKLGRISASLMAG